MSLETPEKVRRLQRKLYIKAKQEPDYRFYLLYDKVYRADILAHAYRLCTRDGGAAGRGRGGVRGHRGGRAWKRGWRGWERSCGRRRIDRQPVRRVMIPKPGGGERPLGIPTIRDRVVQTAAKLVLEPIFEADFEAMPMATDRGARPKKRSRQCTRHCARGTRMSSMPTCRNTSTRFLITN